MRTSLKLDFLNKVNKGDSLIRRGEREGRVEATELPKNHHSILYVSHVEINLLVFTLKS